VALESILGLSRDSILTKKYTSQLGATLIFMRAGERSSGGLLANYFFMSKTPILAVSNLQNSIKIGHFLSE